MEVTRRIQVRNRASSCRPGLGLGGGARKTGEKGSATVGTVSGLTLRGRGVGGWRAVAQWAARAGPPFPVRRLAGGGPLRRWNSPRGHQQNGPSRGGICGMKLRSLTRSSPTGNFCASAGRERKMGENRPTVV